MRGIIVATLLLVGYSISFTYKLQPYGVQCFTERVQKDSRYQFSVKGQNPSFAIALYTPTKSIYQEGSSQSYEKSYSAFATDSEVLFMCLTNTIEEQVTYNFQFHHGIDLQKLVERKDEKDLRGIQFHVETAKQTIEMMRTNFRFGGQRGQFRTGQYQNMSGLLTVSVAGLIVGILVMTIFQLRSFKKELAYKKII